MSFNKEAADQALTQYLTTRSIKDRNVVVQHHFGLVNKVMRKFKIPYKNKEDIFNEGVMGLITAVEKYDPEVAAARSSNFTTYAVWWVRAKVAKAVAIEFNEENGSTYKDRFSPKAVYHKMIPGDKHREYATGEGVDSLMNTIPSQEATPDEVLELNTIKEKKKEIQKLIGFYLLTVNDRHRQVIEAKLTWEKLPESFYQSLGFTKAAGSLVWVKFQKKIKIALEQANAI